MLVCVCALTSTRTRVTNTTIPHAIKHTHARKLTNINYQTHQDARRWLHVHVCARVRGVVCMRALVSMHARPCMSMHARAFMDVFI